MAHNRQNHFCAARYAYSDQANQTGSEVNVCSTRARTIIIIAFIVVLQQQQQTIRRRGRMSTLLRALHILENIFRGRQLFFSHFSCDLDLIADTHTTHTHSHTGCSPVIVIGAFICPLGGNCSGTCQLRQCVQQCLIHSYQIYLSIVFRTYARTHSRMVCRTAEPPFTDNTNW